MTKDSPAVSVLMAVRDGERFLDAALASLAAQTFREFEIILVDNGSRDGTAQIIAEWSRQESRLRTFRLDRPGLARSLIAATSLARAPFLARLDADDLALPERLGQQYSVMKSRPALGLLGSSVELIDGEGRRIGQRRMAVADAELRLFLRSRNPFCHSTIMMRRDAYEKAGGYRNGLRICEDFDLWCRMAEVSELANLDQPLVRYRIHGASMSSRQPVRMLFADTCILAAGQARRLKKPEPFARGVPQLRRALAFLGIERSAFLYRVLKATSDGARVALENNERDLARRFRRHAYGLLFTLPFSTAMRHGVWRVFTTYTRPNTRLRLWAWLGGLINRRALARIPKDG